MIKSEQVDAEPQYKPFRNVFPGLVFLTFIFLLNFVSRVIFAPFLPVIEADLGLSHTGSGSFFLFISAGYCISILGSGFVSSRLSHKKTIVLSVVASGSVLCLLSTCTSIMAIRVVLFCLGISAGLYLPSGLASITKTVSPSYWARGVAIHELAPNLGFVLVPVLSAFLLDWISWSQSLLLIGVILATAGVAYGLVNGSDAGYGVKPNLAVYRDVVKTTEFWVMVILFSLAICSTLGLYTMLPLFLVSDRKFDHNSANHLISLSRICPVIMPLIAGWFGDRFGNYRVITIVLFVTGMLTIPIGLLSGYYLLVFLFLQPMLSVCFFPSGFAILSGIGGKGGGNVAVTLCIPLAFLFGAGVIPTMVGLIGDHYSLGAGFICSGWAILCGGLLGIIYFTKEIKNV